MPQLVARLVTGAGMGIAALRAVILHVADGAEVRDLSSRTKGHVFGLRFAQKAGERQLLLVGHVLVRKAQKREGVDRVSDPRHVGVRQISRESDPGHAGAEIIV